MPSGKLYFISRLSRVSFFEEVPTTNEVVITRSKLGHSMKRLLDCKFL